MIVPRVPVETGGVARHYDELDEFYREVWGEHVHHGLWDSGCDTPARAARRLVRMVADRAGITPGCRVCDVGCGYGGTARLLACEYQATVTGLTVSEAQFRYACERTSGHGNPRFLLRCWEENGLSPGSFDAVVSIECVSHVADKPGFFREIERVLRPGGTAVVLAWLAGPKAGRPARRFLLEPICREGRLPGMATAGEYAGFITESELHLDSYAEISRAVRKTWSVCAWRLLGKLVTRRKYLQALLDRERSDRVFAVTLFRIIAAYYSGAMQYGVFQISKPDAVPNRGNRSEEGAGCGSRRPDAFFHGTAS